LFQKEHDLFDLGEAEVPKGQGKSGRSYIHADINYKKALPETHSGWY